MKKNKKGVMMMMEAAEADAVKKKIEDDGYADAVMQLAANLASDRDDKTGAAAITTGNATPEKIKAFVSQIKVCGMCRKLRKAAECDVWLIPPSSKQWHWCINVGPNSRCFPGIYVVIRPWLIHEWTSAVVTFTKDPSGRRNVDVASMSVTCDECMKTLQAKVLKLYQTHGLSVTLQLTEEAFNLIPTGRMNELTYKECNTMIRSHYDRWLRDDRRQGHIVYAKFNWCKGSPEAKEESYAFVINTPAHCVLYQVLPGRMFHDTAHPSEDRIPILRSQFLCIRDGEQQHDAPSFVPVPAAPAPVPVPILLTQPHLPFESKIEHESHSWIVDNLFNRISLKTLPSDDSPALVSSPSAMFIPAPFVADTSPAATATATTEMDSVEDLGSPCCVLRPMYWGVLPVDTVRGLRSVGHIRADRSQLITELYRMFQDNLQVEPHKSWWERISTATVTMPEDTTT